MTVDEVVLIKGWDSLEDGRTRFTPHGAIRAAGHPGRRRAAREHRGAHPGGDRG